MNNHPIGIPFSNEALPKGGLTPSNLRYIIKELHNLLYIIMSVAVLEQVRLSSVDSPPASSLASVRCFALLPGLSLPLLPHRS